MSCWRRDSSSLKSPCKGHRVPVGPAALFAAPRPSTPAFPGSSTPGSRGCDLAASRSLPLIYMFFLSSRSRSTNFDSPLPQRPARLRRGYSEPSLYHRTRLTRGSAPPQVTAEHEASRWEQHSPSSKPQQPPSSSGRGTASPRTQQGPAHTCTPGVLALRPSFDARQHRPTRQLPPPQLTLLTLLLSCQGPGEVPRCAHPLVSGEAGRQQEKEPRGCVTAGQQEKREGCFKAKTRDPVTPTGSGEACELLRDE